MDLNPSVIFKLATAYWDSSVFLTANRLNLFSIISESEKTASELAGELGTVVHSTEMFLNTCVSLGLIEKTDGKYKNSALSETFLVKGKPSYLGDALKYSDDLYPVWGRLEDTLRSGTPALKPETILGEDPEKTRNFVMGMHNRALGVGSSLAEKADLAGRNRLLDVGGGPATYSILLARKNPDLKAKVMDLPKVVEIAQEIIKDFKMEERVQAVAGDYTKDPFPEGNDCVLNSGIFHRETEDSCRVLINKAYKSLEPGGLFIINDVFCNKEKDGPPFVMLFGINMMLTSEFGTVHSTAEVTQWLKEAGFTDISSEPLPPPMPHTLIKGVKP
jgi:ubiquinone/menaquinone biosynthesis C-methylase UbiE